MGGGGPGQGAGEMNFSLIGFITCCLMRASIKKIISGF